RVDRVLLQSAELARLSCGGAAPQGRGKHPRVGEQFVDFAVQHFALQDHCENSDCEGLQVALHEGQFGRQRSQTWRGRGKHPRVGEQFVDFAVQHFALQGADLFTHYIAGKPLADCSVSVLSGALLSADLLLEVLNVSRDLNIRRELVLQLSRMRQRLLCGPIQRFLRSGAGNTPALVNSLLTSLCNISPFFRGAGNTPALVNSLLTSLCNISPFLQVHRFICSDVLRFSLTLQYCREIAKTTTEGPKRLSAASAAAEVPEALRGEIEDGDFPADELAVFLLFGIPARIFSGDFSAATRSLRALTLSEMGWYLIRV
ncbi:hypothetical protein, conserved, partial [Eimeria necatrix]